MMVAIIGALLCLTGSLFFLLSAIGLLRMPDAFNRMQAGTKATTLGSILFLIGVGLMRPDYLGRTLLLALFIVLTNPVSSNALARAAHGYRKRIGAVLNPDSLSADSLSADSLSADSPKGTGGADGEARHVD